MRTRRRAMAEINVVPYIDVMLVLLIIFMITAPLLQLGVEIELPESNAEPMEQQQDPVVVAVRANGDFYLVLDGEPEQIDPERLGEKVAAFVRTSEEQGREAPQVLIGGDEVVDYGRVYQAMAILQSAGVKRIGLISDPSELLE